MEGEGRLRWDFEVMEERRRAVKILEIISKTSVARSGGAKRRRVSLEYS